MAEQARVTPIFVPIAFSEDEAIALVSAARVVFRSAVVAGHAKDPNMAPLARAMVRLAEATDKARAPASTGIDHQEERDG